MFKVRSWILLQAQATRISGMSVPEKKSTIVLPCQQNPVAWLTVIMETQKSGILAHAGKDTKNSPGILAVCLTFQHVPKAKPPTLLGCLLSLPADASPCLPAQPAIALLHFAVILISQ